jgi:hypothetical protein
VRIVGIAVVAAAACAPLPPPRAIVAVQSATGDASRHAVLVTPTTCESSEELLCSFDSYSANAQRRPLPSVDQLVDPIVRLKLELAGYSLTDASTLRLTSVDRKDVTVQGDARGQTSPVAQATHVEEGPTVASLTPPDQGAAASSLGLTAALRSTLHAIREGKSYGSPIRFELVLEMFALPDGAPLWTVRCSERLEDAETTARLVANCAGDGVLAWRAPDAVIGQRP